LAIVASSRSVLAASKLLASRDSGVDRGPQMIAASATGGTGTGIGVEHAGEANGFH
jgi:hypothetical protein